MAEEQAPTPDEEPQDAAATDTPDAQPDAASPDTAGSEADAPDTAQAGPQTEVAEAEMPQGVKPGPDVRGGQVDILLDTTMPVEIRLGDVDLEVRDLLKIGPGSIVTVDKYVGEPLDLYLKGIRFATGQLVVAGDTLGVRIIEILPRRKSDRAGGVSAAAAAVAAAQDSTAQGVA
jgi:flagellar motor switch protein FliN/FliY